MQNVCEANAYRNVCRFWVGKAEERSDGVSEREELDSCKAAETSVERTYRNFSDANNSPIYKAFPFELVQGSVAARSWKVGPDVAVVCKIVVTYPLDVQQNSACSTLYSGGDAD